MTFGLTSRIINVITYFDVPTYRKGRDYFEADRVRWCKLQDRQVTGVVMGTKQYVSVLVLGSDLQNIVSSRCTCPVGAKCKHTAALALKYNRAAEAVPAITLAQSESGSAAALPSGRQFLEPVSQQMERALYALARTMQGASGEEDGSRSRKSNKKMMLIYVLSDAVLDRSALDKVKPEPALRLVTLTKDGMGAMTRKDFAQIAKSAPACATPDDIHIARLWQTFNAEMFYSFYSQRIKLEYDRELFSMFMNRLLATGKCYLLDDYKTPLMPGPAIAGKLVWKQTGDDRQLLTVVPESAEQDSPDIHCLRWTLPWYVDRAKSLCGPIDLPHPAELVEAALKLPHVHEWQTDSLRFMLSRLGLQSFLPAPKTRTKVVERLLKPRAGLQMLQCEQSFLEGSGKQQARSTRIMNALVLSQVHDRKPEEPYLEDDQVIKEVYDLEQHKRNRQVLAEMGFTQLAPHEVEGLEDNQTCFLAFEHLPWSKLLEASNKLKEDGWSIHEKMLEAIRPLELNDSDLDIEISDTDDNSWWFSLALNIDIAGKKRPLLPILISAIKALPDSPEYNEKSIESLNQNGRFVSALDGVKMISLPFDRIRPMLHSLHELLLNDRLEFGDKVRLSLADAEAMLKDPAADSRLWHGTSGMRSLAERMRKLATPIEPMQAIDFKAELREYQLEGLSWMQNLRQQKFGGILADDMGLGKTVQLLALISAERQAGRLKKKPFLVVCPTSVLPNWLKECSRFAPKLKVLALSGQARGEKYSGIAKADLVLSTYPLIARDVDKLKEIEWSGIALDEAQNIKNEKTQVAKAACSLKADYRFCLTGTPIENHLGELWSQFQFLLPGYLSDAPTFKSLFRTPIEKEANTKRQELLAARVKPFILRRTKEEVAKELPEKTEIIKEVELEGRQRDLYETVRLTSTKQVRDEIARKGFKSSQIMILDALLKLRQVCCDPKLVKLQAARKVAESAKLSVLMEMLTELQEEGRKVLLFSQFTSMLDLIAAQLESKGIKYVELRGDTKDRTTPVHEFQDGAASVFLLSLKAGGTGLNLTAADTVIHYDPWWNPAVEDQATDRAHRIGQSKKVFVYKLVVKGSIEERMLELQERKKEIAGAIFNKGSKGASVFSEADIDMLLRPIEELDC